ncbi:MAG: invasion associated locus B family protein [Marinibacterium sp.]
MHSASAQQAADPEPPQDAAPLDMGKPVSSGPQTGQRYVKDTFGDWKLTCVRTDSGTDPCSIVQVLLDQGGNPVAEVTLFRIEKGQAVAGATVIVPLETLLPGLLTIGVDTSPPKQYAYQFCNPVGCVAQVGLTQEDVDAFKRGRTAKVSLVPAAAPNQVIALQMSLSGFTAGFEALEPLPQN